MNPDQLKSAGTSLLVVVTSVLTVLVAAGIITPDKSSTITTALEAFIPAAITIAVIIYKLFPHADSAKIVSAATIPGVHIQVDTTAAPQAVTNLANDPTVKNVNPL